MGTPYEDLTGLANAIREKTGKTDKLSLDQMYNELRNFKTDPNYYLKHIMKSTIDSIDIPDGVDKIGGHLFKYCRSLKEINIPNSVTTIGEDAFYNCTSLTNVIIPDSVTNIGDAAFYECTAITSIILSNSLTKIGRNVFRGCYKIYDITIPESVTSIDYYAFYGCTKLSKLILLKSDSIVTLSSSTAFEQAGNIYIYVPSNLVSSYKSATNWSVYTDRILPIE